ncbi:hypothetical protein SAMN02927923_03724 [Microvirga guangxiensis]|uniref:Uncharacterized protein n=1 Tax=Microvirga guangxiensis TaxID=549386 RepID=A0A1G5KY86_9HYPH|nr:hypothetical protein SAMN02927923_03724 [Microvirga guangxiensis]
MGTKARRTVALAGGLKGLLLVRTPVASDPGDIFLELFGSETSWTHREYMGHAFTCIALHLNNGVKEDCYGFYPKNDGKGAIYGPGIVRSEASHKPTRFSRTSATVKVKISEEQRRQILEAPNRWNSTNYNLSDDNCIAFVH